MKSRQTVALTALVIILSFLALPALAANNVSVDASGNGTAFTTTATWTELENISITAGTTGVTSVLVSYIAAVNYSGAIIYGGIYRNGVQVNVFNMTSVTYMVTGAYETNYNETVGTHSYALKVYSTAGKKGTVYKRNISAKFLSAGGYGTGSGGAGNISSILCSPAGVLDCTGTGEVTIALTQWMTNATAQINITQVTDHQELHDSVNTSVGERSNAVYSNATFLNKSELNTTAQIGITQVTNLRGEQDAQNISITTIQGVDTTQNTSITNTQGVDSSQNTSISNIQGVDTAQNTSISNLQSSDTIHDSKFNYVNATYLPNSTYNGNFPNTSLSNYLLIATYTGNFPNSSLANYLLITTYAGDFPNNTINSRWVAWDGKADAPYANQTFYNKSRIPNCNPTTEKAVGNGSEFSCVTDQTSSFSIASNSNPAITGAAILVSGTGVVLSQSGSNITISMPAAGITNSSVNPHTFNLSNGTSGFVPESRTTLTYPTHAAAHGLNDSTNHTGYLGWPRIESVLINLSNSSIFTGQIADALIASAAAWNAKIGTISASGPLKAETVGTTVTLTCDVANATQAGCLASADYSTFVAKITNTTAQITIPQVTLLQLTLDAVNLSSANNNTASQGRDDAINESKANAVLVNTTFASQVVNNTYFNTTFKPGIISVSTNTSSRANESNILIVPGPYAGTITELNITVVAGSGVANISWFVSDTLVGNVSLLSGSYGSTTGLSVPFTTGDTVKAVLNNASPNLRMVTSARTQRS